MIRHYVDDDQPRIQAHLAPVALQCLRRVLLTRPRFAVRDHDECIDCILMLLCVVDRNRRIRAAEAALALLHGRIQTIARRDF